MKASDINLARDIRFQFEKGLALYGDMRLLLFDAGAIGLLRQSIIEEVGDERARDIFFKFGFLHGYSDFMQVRLKNAFDTEMDLLASGPVIHTWEGIVHAAPTRIEFDRKTGLFEFTGVWTNSYEAEQYLCYNKVGDHSVCWTLTGYASGWCTGFWGSPLLAMEPFCVGKGDPHCGWDIRPPEKHGAEGRLFARLIKEMLGGA